MEQPIEWFFFACSIFGGFFFVVRLLLQIMGFINISDIDIQTDHDAIHTDHDISDSFDSFKYFTIQNLTAFFMMFGLVGMGMIKSHINIILTLICACFFGGFTVYLIIKIFSSVSYLESSGTLDMNNAIGQEGSVYLTIPKNGSGQIQISIQDRMQIFDAICEHGEVIETGERVIVLRVLDGYTLSVEKM
ncbi:Nodulation efficiency, NfeD [Candidatus Magnetomorum sp. HK-1]|nr:Nodulation efficiency, NfeD [Candidatus Magnetomorum sp. HK-1]